MNNKVLRRLMVLVALLSLVIVVPARANANSLSSPIVASMDKTIIGKLSSESDIQYYKFTTTNNSYFVLNFIPQGTEEQISSGWNIDVLDANYKVVAEYHRTREAFKSMRFSMGANAVFYVKVESYYNNVRSHAPVGVQYSISANQTNDPTWEVEVNDTTKKANALTAGNNIYGTIWKMADVDYYKYKITKNGYAQFTFIPEETDGAELGWNVSFYTKSMKKLYQVRVIEDGFKSVRFNLKKGSIIYVKVESYNNKISSPLDMTYSLSVAEKATKNWEKGENNNSFKNASVLKSKLTGTLYTANDVDYYKVKTTKAKRTVRFAISGNSSDLEDGFEITVYDANKKEISKYNERHVKTGKTMKLKPGKVYYIKVSPTYLGWSSSPVDITYSLKLGK